jgi:hypothetical protein
MASISKQENHATVFKFSILIEVHVLNLPENTSDNVGNVI